MHPTGEGQQRMAGFTRSTNSPTAGYPKLFNVEMDPHEDLNVGGLITWASEPSLDVVAKYKETLKKYPNPPAPNLTKF
jgi:hypothetical protein